MNHRQIYPVFHAFLVVVAILAAAVACGFVLLAIGSI